MGGVELGHEASDTRRGATAAGGACAAHQWFGVDLAMLPHAGSTDSHGPGQGSQRPLPTATHAPTVVPAPSQRLQPNWQGAHSGELQRVTIAPNALDGEQIQTVVSDRT